MVKLRKGLNIQNREKDEEEENITQRKIGKFLNIFWLIFKILLALVLIFPFLDKLRQKDLVGKISSFISEYDIGCSSPNICNCTCPKTKNGF